LPKWRHAQSTFLPIRGRIRAGEIPEPAQETAGCEVLPRGSTASPKR
jgi:hypothetical protein